MAIKKTVQKKAAKKKVKKATAGAKQPETVLMHTTTSAPPCVCEKKRKYWYCMKINPDGSKVKCLGPFETKKDCEAESHLCDI